MYLPFSDLRFWIGTVAKRLLENINPEIISKFTKYQKSILNFNIKLV